MREKIDSELKKVSASFQNDVSERTKSLKYITELPKEGLNGATIMEISDGNLGLGKKNVFIEVTVVYAHICTEHCISKYLSYQTYLTYLFFKVTYTFVIHMLHITGSLSL